METEYYAINKQMLQEVQKQFSLLTSRMCNLISFYSKDLKFEHDHHKC